MTDPKPVPRVHPLARKGDAGNHPAFPITAGNQVHAIGMSLWDAAALAALSGFCANPTLDTKADALLSNLSETAAKTADAFIAERARRLKEPTDD